MCIGKYTNEFRPLNGAVGFPRSAAGDRAPIASIVFQFPVKSIHRRLSYFAAACTDSYG